MFFYTQGHDQSDPALRMSHRTSEPLVAKPNPNEPRANGLAEASKEAVIVIPKTLSNSAMPLLLTGGSCEILSDGLYDYGLSPEESAELVKNLNLKAAEFRKMEAENSELITAPNGDQYFRIAAFSEAGKKIRQSVEKEISTAFANFRDDRAEVFKHQLFRSRLFDDYGETVREISIDAKQTSDGQLGYVFSLRRYHRQGGEIGGYSSPSRLPEMAIRYGALLERHHDKIVTE